jgi:hypothetical protein
MILLGTIIAVELRGLLGGDVEIIGLDGESSVLSLLIALVKCSLILALVHTGSVVVCSPNASLHEILQVLQQVILV